MAAQKALNREWSICSFVFVFVDRTHVPCHRLDWIHFGCRRRNHMRPIKVNFSSRGRCSCLLNIFVFFFSLIFFIRIRFMFRAKGMRRDKCALPTFVTHLFTKKYALSLSKMYENSYLISRQAHIWIMAIGTVTVAEHECAACACRSYERVTNAVNGGRWLRSATVSRFQPDGIINLLKMLRCFGKSENNTVSIDTGNRRKNEWIKYWMHLVQSYCFRY